MITETDFVNNTIFYLYLYEYLSPIMNFKFSVISRQYYLPFPYYLQKIQIID